MKLVHIWLSFPTTWQILQVVWVDSLTFYLGKWGRFSNDLAIWSSSEAFDCLFDFVKILESFESNLSSIHLCSFGSSLYLWVVDLLFEMFGLEVLVNILVIMSDFLYNFVLILYLSFSLLLQLLFFCSSSFSVFASIVMQSRSMLIPKAIELL